MGKRNINTTLGRKQMIGIINYRAGNLQNLHNALDFQQIPNRLLDSPEDFTKGEAITKLILPGVGSFGHAMKSLHEFGFVDFIKEKVAEGMPLLGICVGMQLLFTKGFEDGEHEGLGLIEGEVRRFTHDLKIPQIGWNNTRFTQTDPLVEGLREDPWFYFVHSYACMPTNKANILGLTDYGGEFCSMVKKNNILGVQFHPEKSQEDGLALLKNFWDKVLSC